MTLKFLKTAVTIVVLIATVLWFGIRAILTLLRDTSAQAAAATPDAMETLKAHGKSTAAKGVPIAAKIDADLRKVFKIKAKTKADVMAGAASNN